jgi:murein DD-endopeptidase MepM/ murein hydrolase activator NlpD
MARRLVLATILVALLSSGAAAGDPGTQKARIDARIGDLRARADQADQSEGVLSTELSAMSGRVRDAEAAVVTEQARLDALVAELDAERAHLASLQQKIADQTARLVVFRRQYDAAHKVLAKHLRAIYEADNPDVISVVLGARSFSELLDGYDLLRKIGRQDQRIAFRLAAARTSLERARAETERAKRDAARSAARIAARAEAQRQTRDRIVESRDALVSAQKEKSHTLAQVKEDKESFLAEADSLASQSAALAATIAAAQEAAEQAATSSSSAAAPASSGALGWPVAGPVTSGFGSRWGRMHEGIDIGVPEGTPVHAAAAGTVIYAGWMTGYGNIVVIDHGNGLSTAYAHNSQLSVGQGASVGKGSVIALSGNTGHSTGPHVHFEVRVNGSPVDPLGYL